MILTKIKRGSYLAIVLVALTGCTSHRTPTLGAQKQLGAVYSFERWYLNSDYDERDIPSGTAFYGAAAQKIKHKFTIKYYVNDYDLYDKEIPPENMWKVTPHEKVDDIDYSTSNRYYENIYLYEKNEYGYVRRKPVRFGFLMPVQSCDDTGWCKTYNTQDEVKEGFLYDFDRVLYIEKKYLYQGKTQLADWQIENEKVIEERNTHKAVLTQKPFITPPDNVCLKHSGELSELNTCSANWFNAKRICADLGARLPTVDEFRKVVVDCGGFWKEHSKYRINKTNSNYKRCYWDKGFIAGTPTGYYTTTEYQVPTVSHTTILSVKMGNASTYLQSRDSKRAVLCHEM